MELFFDVETSGLPLYREPYNHPSQPFVVQLAAILSDSERIYGSMNVLIKPNGRVIEAQAKEIHGITEEIAEKAGVTERSAASMFWQLGEQSSLYVCHNKDFDVPRVAGMIWRTAKDHTDYADMIINMPAYCTMKHSMNLLNLPAERKWCKTCRIEHEPGPKCPQCGQVYEPKWPKLAELYMFLFGEELVDAHDAWGDVVATRRCYYELRRREGVAT